MTCKPRRHTIRHVHVKTRISLPIHSGWTVFVWCSVNRLEFRRTAKINSIVQMRRVILILGRGNCSKIQVIATDKAPFSSEKCWYLSYFSMKTYVVGTHLKYLTEALLMSTHNICFHGEIRIILCGYPLLSVAMTGYHIVGHFLFFELIWMKVQNVHPHIIQVLSGV